MTLGLSQVTFSVHQALHLNMSGPAIKSISPNIGSAGIGTITVVTVLPDSSTEFTAATRFSIGSDVLMNSTQLSSLGTRQLRISSRPENPQLLLMVEHGRNTKPFYQYDPERVRVTSCLPTSGILQHAQIH